MKNYVKYGAIASLVCGASIFGLKTLEPHNHNQVIPLGQYQSYINTQLNQVNNEQDKEFSKENILNILNSKNIEKQTFFYISPDKLKLQPYEKNDIHFIFNGKINRINADIKKDMVNDKMTISEHDTREQFPVVIEGNIDYKKYSTLIKDHRIGDFVKYGKITTIDKNGNQNNLFLNYNPQKYIANNIVVNFPDTKEDLKVAFFDVFDYLEPYHVNNNKTFFSYFENSLGEKIVFDKQKENFDVSYSSTLSFFITVFIIIVVIIAICIFLLLLSSGAIF